VSGGPEDWERAMEAAKQNFNMLQRLHHFGEKTVIKEEEGGGRLRIRKANLE